MFQDKLFHTFEGTLFPGTFFGLLGDGADNVEIKTFSDHSAAAFGIHKILFPVRLSGIFVFVRVEEDLLALGGGDEHLAGKGNEFIIFVLLNVHEDPGKLRAHDVLIAAVDPKAVGSEGITVFREVQLQDNAFVGVELCPLVRRVKDEIAQ